MIGFLLRLCLASFIATAIVLGLAGLVWRFGR